MADTQSTDTEDQDSLDERIDSEQRIHNQQLWTSFQNAACCITKLYKDRTQPNVSPWVPFQHAASNLTTLYKDCIESQRKFARIGYQVGKRRQMRDWNRLLKKHKIPTKQVLTATDHFECNLVPNDSVVDDLASGLHHNNVTSILEVNQLNLDCDETPSHSMQAQASNQMHLQSQQQQQLQQQQQQFQFQAQQQPQQQTNLQILLGNNEDDLLTFQQALAQPAARGIKSSQNRRPCSNTQGYLNNRSIDHGNEEERLLELNQFLSEEYHRHVGSRKRSCPSTGGNHIKRLRDKIN